MHPLQSTDQSITPQFAAFSHCMHSVERAATAGLMESEWIYHPHSFAQNRMQPPEIYSKCIAVFSSAFISRSECFAALIDAVAAGKSETVCFCGVNGQKWHVLGASARRNLFRGRSPWCLSVGPNQPLCIRVRVSLAHIKLDAIVIYKDAWTWVFRREVVPKHE